MQFATFVLVAAYLAQLGLVSGGVVPEARELARRRTKPLLLG